MVVGILMAMYASPSAAVQERRERTFMIVKPDGVQRGLIGKVVSRLEKTGFKLVAMKFLQAAEETLKKHYEERSDQPFFQALIKYMQMGPIVIMVWEGKEVIKRTRDMIGATDPLKSKPGTIRGDYDGIMPGRKVVHGSDSLPSSKREIELWFEKAELIPWKQCLDDWIFKEN
ncbi:nucleoside diphosphate kinase B-like [Ixodes scapularis]|uniref:nucleoside diphosphate kinase B-like n=1 Tax=Ixodes scapularis TaxID=6945 RepID=UPI001C39541A|nr:nucleoside diphosphate kinase B-like [Ixodes scapularis]